MTDSPERIVVQRGSATLAELGLDAKSALELAKKTPALEPVFLVKFRSRQGKTRVEEIRAYGWPGQKIALAHLGYLADDARLLRLEVRQPAAFPGRLFARFEKNPKQLEELRTTAKLYERAMKQAPSKPGRAERDVLPLLNAFKKLGSDVAIEMLIDTASVFQEIDNTLYASKMLGNLLKLVKTDKTVDVSLLARTVLTAADDGVFNAALYEHTWTTITKKNGVPTALGFGLRVFRRLLSSGRAIPTDFVKVMRKAALLGKIADFEGALDSTIVWGAGIPSFWNTSRKTAEWRDGATQEHGETQLLRNRLREIWMRAEGEPGAAWKREIWGRIQVAMPELTSYGRTVLTENLLAFSESSAVPKEEGERLLESALAMLVKPPRNSDRARVEQAGNSALFRISAMLPDLLWERTGVLEDALRTATGNLTSFVAICDLLSDVSESTTARQTTLLRAIPGLEAAWTGALVAALSKTENRDDDDDDYSDDDDDDTTPPPFVTLLGESLSLLTPDSAPTHLAELGKLVASRLSRDIASSGVQAWARVLGTLHALGPVGVGVTTEATALFVKAHGKDARLGHAAPIAHLLDVDALRVAAESRRVVDEILEVALTDATPVARRTPYVAPTKETGTDSPHLKEVVKLDDGTYRALWMDDDDVDDAKAFAITSIAIDAAGKVTQSIVVHQKVTGLRELRLWPTPEGLRVITVKDRAVQVLDGTLKVVGKLTLPEDFKGSWGLAVHVERFHVLFEKSEEVIVIDRKLKVVSEVSGKGYGHWWISESPDGVLPPIIVQQSGSELNALYFENKRIGPPKMGEIKSLASLCRTADGDWWVDYTTKKGERKRARWDGSGWKTSPATAPASPVVDFGAFLGGSQKRSTDAGHRASVFEYTGVLVAEDALGTKLGAMKKTKDDCSLVDLDVGAAFFPDAVEIDPSFSARIDAAHELRAAIVPEDGPALARALYLDHSALAAHARNALESREAGKKALALLGDHANALLDASVATIAPRLAARHKLLQTLDRPADASRQVPTRVPGVGRTEIRRLVRNHIKGSSAELVFWALDSDDPSPVVEHFVDPNADGGASTAFTLLRLAQDPKTDGALARRLLHLAGAVLGALGDRTRTIALEAETYEWVDDDDDLASGRSGSGFSFDRSDENLRSRPARKFAKNELPLAWSDNVETRATTVKTWIAETFAVTRDALVEQVGKNEENGRIYRVALEEARVADVSIVWKKDVFKWELTSVSGSATLDGWEATFTRLEALSAELGAGKITLVPSFVRPVLLEAGKRGVALTDAWIERRAELRPQAWTAPPVKGAEDAKSALWVMLTWLLGGLHYEAVSTSKKTFDNVAKTCKLVTSGWYGFTPVFGKKSDADDWDEDAKGGGPPELAALRDQAILRLERGRDLASIVILEDPAKLVDVYQRTVAAGAAPAATKGKAR